MWVEESCVNLLQVFGSSMTMSDSFPVLELLCRPTFAVPLAGSTSVARRQSLELVEAVRVGRDRMHVEDLLQQERP